MSFFPAAGVNGAQVLIARRDQVQQLAVDPDARPNVESIKRDIEFFRANGDLTANVSLDRIVDVSFVDAAVKDLGPYAKK